MVRVRPGTGLDKELRVRARVRSGQRLGLGLILDKS